MELNNISFSNVPLHVPLHKKLIKLAFVRLKNLENQDKCDICNKKYGVPLGLLGLLISCFCSASFRFAKRTRHRLVLAHLRPVLYTRSKKAHFMP